MKPLLSSAPATREDLVAWDHALVRMLRGRKMGSYMNLYARSLMADRRDAYVFRRLQLPCQGCLGYAWHAYVGDLLGSVIWQRCGVCGNIRALINPVDITSCA